MHTNFQTLLHSNNMTACRRMHELTCQMEVVMRASTASRLPDKAQICKINFSAVSTAGPLGLSLCDDFSHGDPSEQNTF